MLWTIICFGCLLALFMMWRGDEKTIGYLTPQEAAERWETEEKPYAMASVFLTEEQAIPQERMGEIYLSVENALTAGGVGSESHPWFYAASYAQTATLQNGTVSCEVELTAVAGEFFRIHPMTLLNGWYMAQEDLMHDRIVLDRQTAWNLFYSMNVAGQYLTVNGVQYQVAAVVDYEPGEYSELAAKGTCRAWVFSDSPALTDTQPAAPTEGEAGAATASQPGYTCLEVVLPQPVKGFALATLKNALKNIIPEDTAITDNSGRFSLESRWSILKQLTTRGISQEAIAYPCWENAARLTENHLALRLVPEVLLGAIPTVSLMVLLLWLNHRRTWGLGSIREAVEHAIDRKHQRDYAARQAGKKPSSRRARRQREQALKYTKHRRGRRR